MVYDDRHESMTLMTCKLPCYQRSAEILLIPVRLERGQAWHCSPAVTSFTSTSFQPPSVIRQHQHFFLLLQPHLRLIGAFYQHLTLGDRIERSRRALAIP